MFFNRFIKYITTILLFSNALCGYAQKIDIKQAQQELQKSIDLEYIDALAARDISYYLEGEWGKYDFSKEEIEQDSTKKILLELYAELELVHAKNNYWSGFIEAGIEVYKRSIDAFERLDSNHVGLAECLARQGALYNKIGESQTAIKNILKAQSIYEKLGKKEEIYWCNALIAACYLTQDDLKTSTQKSNTAIKNLEKVTHPLYLLDAYFTYVKSYVNTRIHQQALDTNYVACSTMMNKAIIVASKINNAPLEAYAQKLLADVYSKQGKMNQAINLCRKIAPTFKKTNFLYQYVETKKTEGLCLNYQQNCKEAIKVLEPVAKIASENGMINEVYFIYTLLANANATLGNSRQGSIYGSRAFTIYKLISNSKKSFEMEALEAQFEKEKQTKLANNLLNEAEEKAYQRNIAILTTLFSLILISVLIYFYTKKKNNNRKLNEALHQKGLLLKEINHRVKNNLQMISSLLEIELEYEENEQSRETLQKTKERVASISLAHQNLYKSDNDTDVDLKQYLASIADSLIKTFDVSIKISIPNKQSVYIDKAQALGFILNELITNSLKYAWKNTPNDKKIDIIYSVRNGISIFKYSDNGVGLPKYLSSKDTLGSTLIKTFAEHQLDGHTQNKNDNGAHFTLKFRL